MNSSKLKPLVNGKIQHAANQQPLINQPINSVKHQTFLPKSYQAQEIEIAEAYEQALEANSLQKIKQLMDKVLEKGA